MAFDYRSSPGVTATQSNQPGVMTIHLPDLPRELSQNLSLRLFCTKSGGWNKVLRLSPSLHTGYLALHFIWLNNPISILLLECR